MKWFYLLMASAGGVAVAIQAIVNGGLGKRVGTMETSFVSFFIGTAALFFVALFFGKGNLLAVTEVPKGQLIGGLLGAFYVVVVIMSVPKIGVSALLIAVILGQVIMGSVIDHFGLFGADRLPLDGKKAAAIALMLASIFLYNHK